MPFTLAHPAAIIPLQKTFARKASLSALIIGSMIPDAVYFLPLGINGRVSHSLAALFWFCIPAGFVALMLFHYFAKRPGASLLPLMISRRLSERALANPIPGAAVFISLACGAATHICWDAFTHRHTFIVDEYELFRMVLFSISGYEVRLYKALQHLSSIAGLLALAYWLRSWIRTTPLLHAPEDSLSLPFKLRFSLLAVMACSGMAYGLSRAASVLERPIEYIAVRCTVGMIVGAGFSFTAFCLGWHLFYACRRRFA